MSTPPPLPGLDLRPLKVDEAAFALREWAVLTARSVLGLDPPGSHTARYLLQLKVRPWRWPARQAYRLERWATKPLRLWDGEERLRHPISLLLIRYLRAARSSRLSWLRGGYRAGIVEPFWPTSLWGVIDSLAWREPRFMKEAGAAFYEHFRRSRPVPGGDLPAPVLRPQVWWLLVDLLGVPELGRPPASGVYPLARRWLGRRLALSMWRLWHRWSRLGRYRQRLSEIARTQLLAASGWAGFWEQWLVGEALLQRPESVAAASSGARQVLDLLPLLAERRYRAARNRLALAAPEDAGERQRIVDPEWRRQMPPWLTLDLAPARRATPDDDAPGADEVKTGRKPAESGKISPPGQIR